MTVTPKTVMLIAAAGVVFAGCAGSDEVRPVSGAPSLATPARKPPAAPAAAELILSPVPTAIPALENPGELAAELAVIEQSIRSPATPDAAMERLGRIQQAAYRKLVANPAWRPVAVAAAPASLRKVVQANIEAGEQLRALTRPAAKLPAWKIVQPVPAGQLRQFYREAEARFGVSWAYLAAIHLVETRMGRIRGTSTAGAQGPMQFMPGTWARYGEGDINDPQDAIFAAARYLKASGAPAAMDRALYAYNRSDKYVAAINAYARQMMENERTYLSFYHWQVYVRTTTGDVLLEVGHGD